MSEALDLGHSLSLLECFTIHFHRETLLQAEDVKDDNKKDTASRATRGKKVGVCVCVGVCRCRSIQIDIVGTRDEPPQLCLFTALSLFIQLLCCCSFNTHFSELTEEGER